MKGPVVFLFFRPIVKIYRPGGGREPIINFSKKKKIIFFLPFANRFFFLKKNIIIYFYFLKLPCLRVCSRARYHHASTRPTPPSSTHRNRLGKVFFLYPKRRRRSASNDMRSFISTHENLKKIYFTFIPINENIYTSEMFSRVKQ